MKKHRGSSDNPFRIICESVGWVETQLCGSHVNENLCSHARQSMGNAIATHPPSSETFVLGLDPAYGLGDLLAVLITKTETKSITK